MATIAEMLAQAASFHQRGALPRAELLYRQVLQVDPAQADALHLLGVLTTQLGKPGQAVVYLQQALSVKPQIRGIHASLGLALQAAGKLEEAVASYRQALALQPDAQTHNNLGSALRDLGRPEEAIASFRQAARLNPALAETHNNLGSVLCDLGQTAEAIACCREAVRLRPDYARAHCNLGNALQAQGQSAEAAACYREAVRLKPDYAEAHNNLGAALAAVDKLGEAEACYRAALRLNPGYVLAHNNLGSALRLLGRLREAEASFREALRLKPDFAEAHNNVGSVCLVQEKFAEAIACCETALKIRPRFAEAYHNLGNAFKEQNRLEEAVDAYQHALHLQAEYPEVLSNLAVSLAGLERLDEAMVRYEESLQIMSKSSKVFLPSDLAEVHWNRSSGWLLTGDFERGWPEYEWRWHKRDLAPRSFPQLLWDGSPLEGKTILLHAEQGLGDTIQFIRYVPQVRERGGRVLVECQPALLRLLADFPGVEGLIGRGSRLPDFDVHAPLLSLPGIFGTNMTNMPAAVPYLRAEPARIALWKARLSEVRGQGSGKGPLPVGRGSEPPDPRLLTPFLVGIGWQGNPKYKGDRTRSVPLAHFAPLARVEGVRLISLQKGLGRDQLHALAHHFPVIDLGDTLDADGAFLDTAAVMRNLDLVIASDSAIVHVAGALAVPIWVPLPKVPDWRWFLGRNDSPWYPTMRLFRQEKRGEWQGVFERMANALEQRLVTSG
jgi:tetratricopeptide (TPR) repeat protein